MGCLDLKLYMGFIIINGGKFQKYGDERGA